MKRVYTNSIKKWATGLGLSGVSLVGLIFMYLFAIGAISNVSYSGDVICAGTELDPCYAYINFTAEEDIFIYPIDYDPWGRNTTFDFDPNVKSWKLERSWGKGWWEYNLSEPCATGNPRCGAKKTGEPSYALVWREGKDYQIRITAYKNYPMDDIKWGSFSGVDEIDPTWIGLETKDVLLDRDYIWSIRGEDSHIVKNKITKDFNSSSRTIKISNSSGTIIEMFPLTPYENHVSSGINTSVAEFIFVDWADKDGIVDDIVSYDVLSDYQETPKDYTWAYVLENDYVDCKNVTELNNISNKNETILRCNNIHEEEVIEFENLRELPYKGKRVNLITDTHVGEYIEFVPVIEGIEVLELASFLVTDLVSYYKLDDNLATTNVIDSLSNNTGTLLGGSNTEDISVAGIINTALDLESSVPDVIRIDDGAGTIADITDGDLTITAWIKAESTPTYGIIVGGGSNGFTFHHNPSNNLRFGKVDVDGVAGDDTFADGVMTFVAVVYDGTANTLQFYINGTPDSGGTDAYSTTFTANTAYEIGRQRGNQFPLDGIVDEVGIWTRKLNDSEILELYNSGAGLSYPFEAADTCTYSSGNWAVDCNDNCSIVSNVGLGGNNLTLTGVGIFDVRANITSFGYIFKPIGCQINVWSSGGLEK